MIRNVILDIGDVLSHFRWAELFRKYLDLKPGEFETLENAMMKSGMWEEFDRGVMEDDEIIEGVISRAPELKAKILEFFRHLDEICIDYDYSIDWINELHNAGYKVYLLSNYGKTAFYECCKKGLQFVPLVDGKVISYEIKEVKPGKAIYEHLLKKYGLNADECVFFDDRPINVEGANKVGIHGILFTGIGEAKKALDELVKK